MAGPNPLPVAASARLAQWQAKPAPADDATQPTSLPQFRHYKPRQGHPDWLALDKRAAETAARVLPLLERPQPKVVRAWRRCRSVATAARGFVANMARARAGREDLLPLYFIWTTHRACNFRCTYCDDHQGKKYPDLDGAGTLDTAGGRKLLDVMRTRASSVYFAGGEPTMRKDLPQLTEHAHQLAYDPIIVNTNGSALDRLLALPAWRKWLAQTDVVVVSLDGLEPAVLRDMWAYRKPLDVLANVLLLNRLKDELGFKLMVNAVIQPGLVQHARDVLDFANDLGIWFSPVPMNAGPRMVGGLRQDPAYRELADTILERKRQGCLINGSLRMNQRLLDGAPLDCRNTLKPHVDADGTLFWPCKASVNVAPQRLNVLDFDHVDKLYAQATAQFDPTGFHGQGDKQCGADCNWAQNYSTDAYAHGLHNPLSLVAEVSEFLRTRS